MRTPGERDLTGRGTRSLVTGILQVLNVSIAVAWWRLAPGPAFELRTSLIMGGLLVAWTTLAISRRRIVPSGGRLSVVGLGITLPVVWMLAIVLCEVAVVFAITTLVFGFFFVALCPLILWGAFLATRFGCKTVSGILVGEPWAAVSEHAA
jgi:hypothetical protein